MFGGYEVFVTYAPEAPTSPVAMVSISAPIVVLVKSNSNIWFLTGTISLDSVIAVILIFVEAEPSTFQLKLY